MAWVLLIYVVTAGRMTEAPVQRFPSQAICQQALERAYVQGLRTPLVDGDGRLLRCERRHA